MKKYKCQNRHQFRETVCQSMTKTLVFVIMHLITYYTFQIKQHKFCSKYHYVIIKYCDHNTLRQQILSFCFFCRRSVLCSIEEIQQYLLISLFIEVFEVIKHCDIKSEVTGHEARFVSESQLCTYQLTFYYKG